MRVNILSQIALLLLAGALCRCTPAAAADTSDNGSALTEQTDTSTTEKPSTENPLMYVDWISLGKKTIEVGEGFKDVSFKLFSSRDWTVDYDRDLISIEPESGPGQVDSQAVRISLREGVAWDSYIRDAVFTAGSKTVKLPFKTVLRPWPLPQPGDTLTIIEYNVERGMQADKANNFDNFVAWVKAHDPDVLLLCECNDLNDETLGRLAVRWGHPYAKLTFDDGWNPAITSKYPMDRVVKFTKGTAHGAVAAKILGINFICYHAVAGWFDTNDWYNGEARDYDGYGSTPDTFDYRIAELHNIFDNTIFKYPEEKRWLISGDFNAVSRTEARWWNNGERYWVEHDYILGLGFWTDIMRVQHPDDHMFTYSRYHDWDDAKMDACEAQPQQMAYERLDYFYISEPLVPLAAESSVLSDDFTRASSDHRPIMLKLIYQE
ncbi:MAG: endonuclease/exonuclease/phosphatase family protein [Bacteroidales bacterium]|nr:endonuclease/exonuclease/phosphatase family protein [Bacteroidales bacterium]